MIRAALLLCLALANLPVFAEDKSPALAAAKAEFSKADRELNDAWAAVKKAWPERRFTELKDVQREWVKYREEHSETTGDKPGAERSPASYIKAAWSRPVISL